MTTLTDDQISDALAALPDWGRHGDAIQRTFELPTFPEAIDLVDRIAEDAEAADHHPDMDIRYTKVTVAFSTHSAGGITQKDVEAAARVDALAQREAG